MNRREFMIGLTGLMMGCAGEGDLNNRTRLENKSKKREIIDGLEVFITYEPSNGERTIQIWSMENRKDGVYAQGNRSGRWYYIEVKGNAINEGNVVSKYITPEKLSDLYESVALK